MLIPSIDLQEGRAVSGERRRVAHRRRGPVPWARRFGRIGEVAVIDLDAARGRGSNREVLRSLLPIARCRVGGGIRDLRTAIDWLDAGAEKVILGTAADPDLLSRLPRERVMAAVDAATARWWTRAGSMAPVKACRSASIACGPSGEASW
jgi:phosphoribosylformimino-5-aminoimidazole carboxamide ribonucleotide (ProFAR) isomerase